MTYNNFLDTVLKVTQSAILEEPKRNDSNFLLNLSLGIFAGAAAGLLLSPDSGENNRRKISDILNSSHLPIKEKSKRGGSFKVKDIVDSKSFENLEQIKNKMENA